MAVAELKASVPRGRRPLPRNFRRATLATCVARRAAERHPLTPTPAPVAVDVVDRAPSLKEALVSARPPRWLWAGFLLIVALLGLSLRGVLQGIPIDRVEMFAFSNTSREVAPKTLGFLDALVSDREEPRLPETPPLAKISREGHVSLPGGILTFPSSFRPRAGGRYDLLIHFHGNTKVVKESAEVANLNAAIAIINLGIGSAPYEEYYAVPGTYEELLVAIDNGLERRGLRNPRVGRIALSGWSAGYGSLSTILQLRRGNDPLDAILIFDGIHAGWEEGSLNRRQLRPFADAAARASRSEIYFGITHSAIDPKAYASTTITADYLLLAAGAKATPRNGEQDSPRYLELESMKGAVSKKLEKRMEPTREARIGSFHVLGYRGETKEHHMAHLFQMGATLLPELVDRWQQ